MLKTDTRQVQPDPPSLPEARHRTLLSFAWLVTGSQTVAEDAVIEGLAAVQRAGGDAADEAVLLRAVGRTCASVLRGARFAPGVAPGPSAPGLWSVIPPRERAILALAQRARLRPSEIAAAAGLEEADIRAALRQGLAAAVANATRRVLVVDDDPISLDVFADILATEGYGVKTARGGRDALAQIRRLPPHVLVTDLAMPDLDGWQLIRTCRADSAFAQCRIVVVTGVSPEDGELPTADDVSPPVVLRKPIRAESLLAAVGQAAATL